MNRTTAAAAVLPLVLLAVLASGCGGSGDATPATVPVTPSSTGGTVEVLGTWIIPNVSATIYHLTFYPDDTYVMTYDGQEHKGAYTTKSGSVTIDDPPMTFDTVAGPEMEQDRLVETRGSEKIEWIRV